MFRRTISAIDRGLNAVVSVLVVSLLAGMVLLSFTQVFLRNIFGSGIVWADVVLRHLVLAIGLFGAVIATRQGRQISIDVISRVVGPRLRVLLGWIAGLFTILISVLMSRAAIVFVSSEIAYKSELGSGIKAWPFEMVIPVGFGMIAFQVILNLLLGRTSQEVAISETESASNAEAVADGDVMQEEPDPEPELPDDEDSPQDSEETGEDQPGEEER